MDAVSTAGVSVYATSMAFDDPLQCINVVAITSS
jgi:hypothetical protein